MIEIDACHIDLIYGLVRSHKPHRLLELGYGSGKTTNALMRAIADNRRGCLDVVDNFADWNGKQPEHFIQNGFSFIFSDETAFVVGTDNRYDFIVADGDHNSTDFRVLSLLNPGGIVVFHDVTNSMFPNLRKLAGLGGMLFQTSSTGEEQCERGLLVFQLRC